MIGDIAHSQRQNFVVGDQWTKSDVRANTRDSIFFDMAEHTWNIANK